MNMHCTRCHHADEIHNTSDESASIMKLGKCKIPGCSCQQYKDAIQKIDEELL